MAKFCGNIGYCIVENDGYGVYTEHIEERRYYGDVLRNARRLQSADKINDDINITNQFSIVADPFATHNFHSMRYIVYMGTKWKISNVSVEYPRLILDAGGVYNE